MIAFTQNLDRTGFEFFKNQNNSSQFILRWILILILAIIPLMGGCATKINGFTATDLFGDTLEAKLANAAANGNAEKVRELVRQGANPNAKGFKNMTPLGWTLANKSLEGVEALLAAGADPNMEFDHPNPAHPMTYAPLIENPAFLAALLKHGGNPNTIRPNSAFFSPLNSAISDIHKVKMLVEAGAEVNAGKQIGRDLAEEAIFRGRFNIVSYLLENGYRSNLSFIAWNAKTLSIIYPAQEPYRFKVLDQLKHLGVETPTKRPPSTMELWMQNRKINN